MCGVTAAYAYAGAGAVDRTELRAVRDHMAARGPDGAGEWFSADGRVGFGHRRLAIIDLSNHGAQPMASSDGNVVICFNGEIYNYRELKVQLQRAGRVFASDSDTEVLLHLYQVHGTAMLTLLRGMFAFTLWDARKREMLVARDAFGIKPMYYADDGKTFRAASQVKALLQARVDTAPEPAGHAGFLLWGSVPTPWTLYRGIRALPAGHFMWVGEHGSHTPQSFCDVAALIAQASQFPANGSRDEALAALAASLRSSVDAHLVADVPVGVFLSAGLDSALLAALARERTSNLRTLTLGFAEYSGTRDDEAPHASEVARLLGTTHDTVTVRRSDFVDARAQLLADMDQPSIDGVNTWFVARAAASVGIKVALSGLGGDELFASYPSFHQVPQLARSIRPFRRVPGFGLAVRRLTEPLVRHLTSPKYAGLLEYGGTLGGAYLLRRGLHMPWELPRLMDPDMARAGWESLQTIARLDRTIDGIEGPARERLSVSALETSWYMRHQLLTDADWAGMAHSVEIRVPLADVQLLKEAAPWLAQHPELSKKDVVRGAAPQLPPSLFERPKTGFNVPVRQWLGGATTSARGLRGWSEQVHRSYARTCRGSGKRRVLVSTLAPVDGGVLAMTHFAVRTLERAGFEPVLAYYPTYSTTPALSVPSYRLLQRRPGRQLTYDEQGRELHGIGAWLPELEFTHYLPTKHWRSLIDSCDAYIAVSGNALAATPFHLAHKPYLAWVATDWEGDRVVRVRQFPWARRLLDTCVNAPVIRRLERRLLRGGRVLALSEYTAAVLQKRADAPLPPALLPVPIDLELFTPKPQVRVQGRLGFAGRFNDPRKNIGLLLEAAALLRSQGHNVHVVLIGDTPQQTVRSAVDKLQLNDAITFHAGLSPREMRDMMQTLDVFVLASHQEGLCISAIESLACGVPVVSTRCGGPEEFVVPGLTGELVASEPAAVAAAVARILQDPALRTHMSENGRRFVEERYSATRAAAILTQQLLAAFPAPASGADASSFTHEAVVGS